MLRILKGCEEKSKPKKRFRETAGGASRGVFRLKYISELLG